MACDEFRSMMWIFKLLACLFLLLFQPGWFVGAATLEGCFAIDKANRKFLINPGSYDPSFLDTSTCLKACGYLEYPLAGLHAGSFCLCANSNYPPLAKQADETPCNAPCTGKSTEKCGHTDFVLVYRITDTRLAIQLDSSVTYVVGSFVSVLISSLSGSNPTYKYDFGDGTATSAFGDHTYATQEDHLVSVTVQNDVSVGFDASPAAVTSPVSGVTLNCPFGVGVDVEFECSIEIIQGNDLQVTPTFGTGPGAVTKPPQSAGSPTYLQVGYVTQDPSAVSLPSDDIHVSGDPVFWVLPATEILTVSKLVSIEAFITNPGDGTINFVIYKPVCQSPSNVYCPTENNCVPSSSCEYDFTMPTHPVEQDTCSAVGEMFCLSGSRCVNSASIRTCSAEPARYETNPSNNPRAEYEIVQIIPVTGVSAGYLYHALATPIPMEIGYVLGARISAAGAKIAYEPANIGSPVEFQYAGTDYTPEQALQVVNKDSGHLIRHHIRGTFVQPAIAKIKHVFDAPGTYPVNVKVSNNQGRVDDQDTVLVQYIVTGLTIDLGTDVLLVNEAVTAYVKITGGVMVNYTWDWGDGIEEITVRQATNYSEADVMTHTYMTDGTFTITVIASNFANNESTTAVVYVQRPLQKHHFQISSNSPQPHPGDIDFTVFINLPAVEDLGTAPQFAVSITFFENSTKTPLSISNNGQSEIFGESIRFSGEYTVTVTMSNKISALHYTLKVLMIEPITNFSLEPMYRPPLPLNGPLKKGLGPGQNIFPLMSPVVFVPKMTTGSHMSYDVNYGDGSPLETVTEDEIPHLYATTGPFTINIDASNALGPVVSDTVLITVQDNIDGIQISELQATTANETKDFDITVISIGTDSCLVIDYGDDTEEIFGIRAKCENHAKYPQATWVQPIMSSFRVSHNYTAMGTFKISAFGFNLVSDASASLFFAVSDFSCNSPKLEIRGGHSDWRGPRVTYFNDYIQVQGVTDVKCKSFENNKVWELEEMNPNTGLPIPGTAVELTGLQSTHRFYLPDADTAEINIAPRTIPIGTWKFTYSVFMKQKTVDNEDYHAYANEFIKVRGSPLKIQILEGQTTSKVIGHGKPVHLQPGVLSRDPDLPDDVADQNFTSIAYFCRRFYEPWRLDDQKNIDKNSRIPLNMFSLASGGCFGTGNGLLDYDGDVLELDTTNMLPNMTYEIMVVVTKGSRVGNASVYFTVKQGNPPQAYISLSQGTLFKEDYAVLVVNPTDDFRLQGTCDEGCTQATYRWQMEYEYDNSTMTDLENWEEHATGITTDTLYIDKDVFKIRPDVRSYMFTFHITNSFGERGKAHVRVRLNEPPVEGYCSITPVEATTEDMVKIRCFDWADEQGITSYEFFVIYNDGSSNKLVGFGSRPSASFFSPLGKARDNYRVKFGVRVNDVLGATTIATIGSIKVKPSNITASEFLSVENTRDAEKMFETLAAEGNSRAINNVILKESSKLNGLHSSELRTLNGTNGTSKEESAGNIDEEESDESERTRRAYWRTKMADLQTQTSIDSIEDIQNSASAASVLTEATNELSHDALVSMNALGSKMVSTLATRAKDADQKTVEQAAQLMFECFTNILEGSSKTISSPLWLLDDFEGKGEAGGYQGLNAQIEKSKTVTEEVYFLTTEEIKELKNQKDLKAKSIVSRTNKLINQVADILKANKLPYEPPSKITTLAGTMTISRTSAGLAGNMSIAEGLGEIIVPSWCALKDPSQTCDEKEIVDIQSNSYPQNHYNYDDSSQRISDKSHIMSLKFEDSHGHEIPITDSREEMEIWIPRPQTQNPTCVNYEQNFNTTSQSGMSIHTFEVLFDQTVVTLEVRPEEFFTTQYGLLIRYQKPPTKNEYDLLWILPYNISLGANDSDYSVFLNESYISNNTGTYYLGIVEIPQEPQGDLPNILFDDHLTPRQLLDDILGLHSVANFSSNYTLCVYLSGCAYFDNQTQVWSTDGVRVGSKTTKFRTQCFTTHLTDFASTWIVPPTPLHFDYIFNNAGFLENITIYITTIVIYVLFFFIFVWARRKDNKDVILQGLTPLADNRPNHKYLYEIAVVTGQWKGSGTNSKVNFILSGEDDETEIRSFEDDKRPILQTGSIDRFVMAVRRPLGALNYMRVWHDNSGKGARQNWFVQYIAVRDLQTRQRFYFIANRWFSLVDDDGQVDRLLPVAGKEQMQGFGHVFSSHSRKNLNDGHLWFSIFLRPVGSRFTRIQRTACCLMALWLEMLVNIMWYKVVPPASSSNAFNIGPFSLSPAQISIGIQSSIIVFPVTLLVVQIFRKARPRKLRKSHRCIIKEQQEELKKKYEVKTQETISHSNVSLRNKSNADDSISTRSEANLLDNQTDNQSDESATLMIKTTASVPPQKPKRKKKFSLPWWSVIFGWILCVLSIAVATVFTILYGIQFGDLLTREWLTSLVVTFITGILFTQPIKIMLIAMFIALIIKSPNADEEDDDEPMEDDKELDKDEMWLHDTSSTAPRKAVYKPPDPAHLEHVREIRMKELKMYDILREICFYVIFLWTLMVFSYSNVDPHAFYMKDNYINTLGTGDGIITFDKIAGVKQFWRWMESGLIPNLYADRWYNGRMDPNQMGFFGDRQSFILGKVVLRQVRIQEALCDVHEKFEETISECNKFYSIFNEDTTDYGRAWQIVDDPDQTAENYRYTQSEDLDGYPFLGKHALYSGGGYVVVLGDAEWKLRQTFRSLYNETWIDKYTRAVFLEFSCYNPHVNLFVVVNFLTEFLPTGAAQTTHRVDVIRLLTYTQGFGLVRIICEVMFFCFILFFIVKEGRNIRREKRKYLKSFWNWIECAIIGFSITAAVIYFYRMYVTNTLLKTLKEGGYRYIKLQYVAYWNELLGYMLGLIVFLATLKFLKLLRFNRRIGVLSSTISSCSSDLSYFGIMFSLVFFAFATAFYLIFGPYVYTYSDFIYTCESLISSILGKFKFHDLIIVESFLGPVFFFLFMSSMSYILINMFLTIINEAFKVVNADISKQSNEYEMVEFMIRRLKTWTGIGKPPVDGADKKPGDEGNEDDEKDPKKEPDIMDEFPEKVDQLLNSIAKIYFDHESFNDVIRGMGQKGKKGKTEKKMISV